MQIDIEAAEPWQDQAAALLPSVTEQSVQEAGAARWRGRRRVVGVTEARAPGREAKQSGHPEVIINAAGQVVRTAARWQLTPAFGCAEAVDPCKA